MSQGTDNSKGKQTNKWNVVYTKTIAGTVDHQKVEELKAQVRDSTENNDGMFFGIWNIQLTPKSPDEDFAKYLMLEHETIEEEDLEMEMQECDKI